MAAIRPWCPWPDTFCAWRNRPHRGWEPILNVLCVSGMSGRFWWVRRARWHKMPEMVCWECKTPVWALRWSGIRAVCRSTKKAVISLLSIHNTLPVWKHSRSKRDRFAAASCEIQRKDDPRQGAASHGIRSPRGCINGRLRRH